MLHVIEEKVRAQRLSNVEIVQGTDADANLPENAIDLALLVDVYHEFSHPQQMLRSIRRSLKTNGRLILVEYRKEDPRIPIAPTHRMSVDEARTEVEAEGFRFDRVVAGIATPTHHRVQETAVAWFGGHQVNGVCTLVGLVGAAVLEVSGDGVFRCRASRPSS